MSDLFLSKDDRNVTTNSKFWNEKKENSKPGIRAFCKIAGKVSPSLFYASFSRPLPGFVTRLSCTWKEANSSFQIWNRQKMKIPLPFDEKTV
jgi:hypothetical protein